MNKSNNVLVQNLGVVSINKQQILFLAIIAKTNFYFYVFYPFEISSVVNFAFPYIGKQIPLPPSFSAAEVVMTNSHIPKKFGGMEYFRNSLGRIGVLWKIEC